MALIDIAGRELPADDRVPHTLEELPQCEGLAVLLPAGTLAADVAPLLPRLALIVVEFPKFRDGRGFTLGRALRERHGFTGDIRAAGHVIPDQLALLRQCGFSSVATPEEHPPAQWQGLKDPTQRQLLHRLLAQPAG
jgi:uncharacterized protein (DUF934 family)